MRAHVLWVIAFVGVSVYAIYMFEAAWQRSIMKDRAIAQQDCFLREAELENKAAANCDSLAW